MYIIWTNFIKLFVELNSELTGNFYVLCPFKIHFINYFSTTNWESFRLSEVLFFQGTYFLSSRADLQFADSCELHELVMSLCSSPHPVTKDTDKFFSTASRGIISPLLCCPCASIRAHPTIYCDNTPYILCILPPNPKASWWLEIWVDVVFGKTAWQLAVSLLSKWWGSSVLALCKVSRLWTYAAQWIFKMDTPR